MGSQYTSILYSGLNDCSHKMTFEAAGFKRILPYRYWNVKEKSFEISQMLNDLNDAPDRSIVILHAAGHDPTGIDPDKQQWKSIAAKIIEKSHFCVFDCSYQVRLKLKFFTNLKKFRVLYQAILAKTPGLSDISLL